MEQPTVTPQSSTAPAASIPAPAVAPAATPPVAAPSVPAAVPPPATPPVMASGGNVSTSTSFKDIFKDINWVDAGIMMIGLAALYYNIYYYRTKIKTMKQEWPELCNRVDIVEAEVANVRQQQKAKTTAQKRRSPF